MILVVRIFLYSSSVYSCHLFLISSASVESIPFLSFYQAHLCMKYSLSISNFLEEISSLSHSVVFLYFFALITEEVFLISPATFWNSVFRCLYLSSSPLFFVSLLFTAICKASSDSHFALLHFFFPPWGWSWSLSPVHCHELPTIVLQALCLSDIESISHLHCIIIRDLI